MSRIYVLQAEDIAIAAARMKVDINYIGILDEKTKRKLEDNHVFIRDWWTEGELHTRRLQRLYHQLMPGDILFLSDDLPLEQRETAIRYAKERSALTVFLQLNGMDNTFNCAASLTNCFADIVIHYKQDDERESNDIQTAANKFAVERIELAANENIIGLSGALALCLLNGLRGEKAAEFYRKAAKFKELPWYDEVAYS
ncbi:hypothetical protein [Paenibacillus sp. IITD108]|uniref:hypothetical protein n=1 Tax=Paenibacillus sp. IITD108 TaxID=3116649 RepID=UPI002F421E8B